MPPKRRQALSVSNKQQLTRIRNELKKLEDESKRILTQYDQCTELKNVMVLYGPTEALIEDARDQLGYYRAKHDYWQQDIKALTDTVKEDEEQNIMDEYYAQHEHAHPRDMLPYWDGIIRKMSTAGERRRKCLNEPKLNSERTVAQPQNNTSTPPHNVQTPPELSVSMEYLARQARMQHLEDELPTFNGESWQWDSYWVAFVETVDQQQSLTAVQKLKLLRKSLKGAPLKAIEDLQNVESNYAEACKLLKKRYGDKRQAVLQLHKKIENLSTVSASLEDQNALTHKIKPLLIEYQRLNDGHDHSALYTMILSKFSPNILNPVLEKSLDTLHILESIQDKLESLIQCKETIQNVEKYRKSYSTENNNEHKHREGSYNHRNTTSDKSHELIDPCVFCVRHNKSSTCLTVKSIEQRSQILIDKQLCQRCLAHGHATHICNKQCTICSGTHHNSLCTARHKDKNDKVVLTMTEQSHNNPESTPKRICLWTGTVKIVHPQTGKFKWVDFMLDTGARVNVISDSLVHELNLPVVGHETMTIRGISGIRITEQQRYSKVNWELHGSDDKPLQFTGITMNDPITGSIPCHPLAPDDVLHIRNANIKLTHPATRTKEYRPQILLGAHDVTRLLNPEFLVTTLPSGLTVISTKIGHILAGAQFLYGTDSSSEHKHDSDENFTFVTTLTEEISGKNLENFVSLDDSEYLDSNYEEEYTGSDGTIAVMTTVPASNDVHNASEQNDLRGLARTPDTQSASNRLNISNNKQKPPDKNESHGHATPHYEHHMYRGDVAYDRVTAQHSLPRNDQYNVPPDKDYHPLLETFLNYSTDDPDDLPDRPMSETSRLMSTLSTRENLIALMQQWHRNRRETSVNTVQHQVPNRTSDPPEKHMDKRYWLMCPNETLRERVRQIQSLHSLKPSVSTVPNNKEDKHVSFLTEDDEDTRGKVKKKEHSSSAVPRA